MLMYSVEMSETILQDGYRYRQEDTGGVERTNERAGGSRSVCRDGDDSGDSSSSSIDAIEALDY